MKKIIRKLSTAALVLTTLFTACKFANPQDPSTPVTPSAPKEDLNEIVYSKYSKHNGAEWNCHDPKLFQDDDGTYYVYSTGWDTGVQVRTSKDLINWTRKTSSPFRANENVSNQYKRMYWDNDFLKWCGYITNDGNNYSGKASAAPNSWAPTVIKQNGKYYMFHGIITDSMALGTDLRPAACITLAISDSPAGPFMPASVYDSQTYSQSSLVRYVWNNNGSATGDAEIGYSGSYNQAGNSWNNGFGCIDPEFVMDVATGELCTFNIGGNTCYAMTYGSWKGGIALIYVDAETLKPVCTVAGTSSFDGKSYAAGQEMDAPIDSIPGNSGVLIAGGLGAAYEGAQLIYNSETGYYYIFVSMGDLTYEYRVGVGRCETIDGNYVDAGGVSMNFAGNLSAAQKYHAIGSKIIGAFGFSGEYGIRCPGGQSIYRDSDGKILFANHIRTNYLPTGSFALQIHQMFFNADGWPVLNQNDYYNEEKDLKNLTLSEIAGTYEAVLTVRGAEAQVFNSTDGVTSKKYNIADSNDTASKKMVIDSNGRISGNYSGSVSMDAKAGNFVMDLKNSSGGSLGIFKGVILESVDWYKKDNSSRKTITFTSLCGTSGEYFFGNRVSTEYETVELSYEDYLCQGDSSLGSQTGVSISFGLNNGYNSDWDAVIKSHQTKINLATMEYLPGGVWSANIYENAAKTGSAAAAEPYKTYYGEACFVTISFNTDGGVVFYKNGLPALIYEPQTKFSAPENTAVTVSDLCAAFISDAGTEGFTFMPGVKGKYKADSFAVGFAVNDEEALKLYKDYKN